MALVTKAEEESIISGSPFSVSIFAFTHPSQLYVLAPPSECNLRLYSTWMEIRGTQHGLFLSDALEGLVKLQVGMLSC